MMLVDLLPIALLGAVLGMDVVTFPQAMISRPIVAATVAGAFIGNASAGLMMGAVLELLALEMLPFGASRYPEWGSASVVGGSLYASQTANMAGALAAALFAALVTALISGKSMVWLRRLNASLAAREHDALARGSGRAVTGLQLFGLSADLVRGFCVTLAAMIVFSPLIDAIVASWGTDAVYSRAIVVAMVAAVSAGAIWKIFHLVSRARILFLAGIALGAYVLVTTS
jgi:mannose/fructose/N-acetylgalactosamine-specific phosphotransferase system component IIC